MMMWEKLWRKMCAGAESETTKLYDESFDEDFRNLYRTALGRVAQGPLDPKIKAFVDELGTSIEEELRKTQKPLETLKFYGQRQAQVFLEKMQIARMHGVLLDLANENMDHETAVATAKDILDEIGVEVDRHDAEGNVVL